MSFKFIVKYLFFLCPIFLLGQRAPYTNFDDAFKNQPICDIKTVSDVPLRNPSFVVTPNPIKISIPCTDSSGDLNNFFIFPFIADFDSISVRFYSQTCSMVSFIGLQALIISDYSLQKFVNSNFQETQNCLASYINTRENGGIVEEFTLRAKGLKKGLKYHLLIDGNGGSQCEFRMQINTGSRDFLTLKEKASRFNILNRFWVDSTDVGNINYCQANDTLTVEVPSRSNQLSYFWSISPIIPGLETVKRIDTTNKVKLFFPQSGKYQLKVYATDFCSTTDTLRTTISVSQQSVDNEDFGSLRLCDNQIANIHDTLSKLDPNGDALFGWNNKSATFNIGITKDSFINAFGCKIVQQINVENLPVYYGADTVVSCITYSAQNITVSRTSDILVTSGNKINNGCDSLIRRHVIIPEIKGTLTILPCAQGKDKSISFNKSYTSYPRGTQVIYIWYDPKGIEISDTDGIDTILRVTEEGIYRIEALLIAPTVGCVTLNLASIDIKFSEFLPTTPSISFARDFICPSDSVLSLKALSLNAKAYNWRYDGSFKETFRTNSRDSINLVQASNSERSYTIRVKAENACGESRDTQVIIARLEKPNTDISLGRLCQGELTKVKPSLTQSAGWNYTWNVANATVVSGNINQYDSLGLIYEMPGNKTITLTASRQGCNSSSTAIVANVIDSLVGFTMSCDPKSKEIDISWPKQPNCVSNYRIFVNNQLIDSTANTSYKIQNLASSTSYNIRIQIPNTCGCKPIERSFTCTTLNCDDVRINTSLLQNVFCESFRDTLVRISVIRPPLYATGKLTYSGLGVDTLGRVNLKLLNTGTNALKVRYQYLDCSTESDLSILINPKPIIKLDIDQPQCANDREGLYKISSRNTTISQIQLDGAVTSDEGRLSVGLHTFFISSPNGCFADTMVSVRPSVSSSISLSGQTTIFEDEAVIVGAIIPIELRQIIDSTIWTYDGMRICNTSVCDSIAKLNPAPGLHQIELILKYGRCQVSDRITVFVNRLSRLTMPNILRSDKDLLTFNSLQNSVQVDQIKIYSRWGEVVYHQKNFKASEFLWNLEYEGNKIKEGVYVYLVEFTDEKGKKQIGKGDFLVIQ